jgi:hypothetical protein
MGKFIFSKNHKEPPKVAQIVEKSPNLDSGHPAEKLFGFGPCFSSTNFPFAADDVTTEMTTTWGQCYKTFFVRNLRIFVIS